MHLSNIPTSWRIKLPFRFTQRDNNPRSAKHPLKYTKFFKSWKSGWFLGDWLKF